MKIKKLFISGGLILILVFIFSDLTQAQSNQSAANKSWNGFWTKFNTAVKNKNRKSIIALTSKSFFSPDGEKIGSWLKDENNWRRLKNSVNLGTKKFACQRSAASRETPIRLLDWSLSLKIIAGVLSENAGNRGEWKC